MQTGRGQQRRHQKGVNKAKSRGINNNNNSGYDNEGIHYYSNCSLRPQLAILRPESSRRLLQTAALAPKKRLNGTVSQKKKTLKDNANSI